MSYHDIISSIMNFVSYTILSRTELHPVSLFVTLNKFFQRTFRRRSTGTSWLKDESAYPIPITKGEIEEELLFSHLLNPGRFIDKIFIDVVKIQMTDHYNQT